MTEGAGSFAQRRPGWQLPSLNIDELHIDSFEPLQKAAAAGRQACPNCGKSRALYCYNCCIPFTDIPGLVLPFQLHIITHAAEAATKATGVHAAVLCPNQVHMHSMEQLPQLDPSRTVVMFPAEDALLPEELDLDLLQHVIIIDSKWRKAKELNGHTALHGMKRVKLPGNPRSSFWRFHTDGTSDEGVCTIEAIHLLMRALAGRLPQPPSYWDNLLWYYAYQHKVVEKAAAERAAKRRDTDQASRYAPQRKKRHQNGHPQGSQKGGTTTRQQQQQQQQQQSGSMQAEQAQHHQQPVQPSSAVGLQQGVESTGHQAPDCLHEHPAECVPAQAQPAPAGQQEEHRGSQPAGSTQQAAGSAAAAAVP